MKTFSLNNLRELTTEEQMRLNGGFNGPCDNVSCSCSDCICSCDSLNPSEDVSFGNNVRVRQRIMEDMYRNTKRYREDILEREREERIKRR